MERTFLWMQAAARLGTKVPVISPSTCNACAVHTTGHTIGDGATAVIAIVAVRTYSLT